MTAGDPGVEYRPVDGYPGYWVGDDGTVLNLIRQLRGTPGTKSATAAAGTTPCSDRSRRASSSAPTASG